MKKKIAALLSLATIFCVVLTACGSNKDNSSAQSAAESSAAESKVESAISSVVSEDSKAESSDTATGEKRKIGILAPAVTHGWVAGVAYYAEERCKELSESVEYTMYTSNDANEMTTQLDDLKTWGAEAIIAFPQWEGMEVPIQSAIDAGITVVNFDIAIDAEGVYRVSGDNEDMGVQGAKYIVEKTSEDATVVILEVPTSGSVSELRKKGFEDTMKEIAPNATILTYATKFTREDGLKDMTDILTANPQIDAVFSMDDETSIGALQAIKEAGRTDIKVITGGGGCQEYFNMMPENEDIWIQSALYSPLMVKEAVDMALNVLNGEKVDDVMIIPTTVVDRENYQSFLDPSSPY